MRDLSRASAVAVSGTKIARVPAGSIVTSSIKKSRTACWITPVIVSQGLRRERRMGAFEYKLATPPQDEGAQYVWLEHAAGFIFFEDLRQYAIDRIDPN